MRAVHAWLSCTDACFDYRVRLPLSNLPSQDWAVSWGGPPTEPVDVVVGQRLTGDCPAWLDLCADPNVLAVYDMDDDLINLDPENAVPYSIYGPVAEQTTALVAAADVVTVCTEHVAEALSKINPRVVLLPICIDRSVLRMPTESQATLGWAGSVFHAQDWPILAAQLPEIARRAPYSGFHSIGADYTGGAFGARGRLSGHQPWPQYFDAMDFGIGLAPLQRSEWNRGKSWTKPLEYAARGIPVIAEAWGQYCAWVCEGLNGFLVHTNDWTEVILTLLTNPTLRATMADAAYARALRQTIDRHIDKWVDVYLGRCA